MDHAAKFPHKLKPSEISLAITVDHTLSICAIGLGHDRPQLISEADCKLDIAVGFDDGGIAWFVEAAEMSTYPAGIATVTPESDPVMWEIVRRSVMSNFKSLDVEVSELAVEAVR